MIVGTRDGLLGEKRRRSERKGSLKWVDLQLTLRYVLSMCRRGACAVTANDPCYCKTC